MRKTLVRNMKDLRNGQDPLLEAWEGASPIGLPDLPEVFFEEMRRHFRLDGSGRLLVLWCGAGVFLPLAESFESILIADPEPDRLAEARRDATRMGIRNVIPLEGGAELLHPRMGRFRLVIVQDAFLRRDRMRRLSFLAKMTEPEGGAVIAEVHRCSPSPIGKRSPWRCFGSWKKGFPWKKPFLAVPWSRSDILPSGR